MNRQQRRAAGAMQPIYSPARGWTRWQDASAPEMQRAPDGVFRAVKNNLYVVMFYWHDTPIGQVLRLAIRRNDAAPVRSWPDLQRIKDELVGTQALAVEVFPARSHMVDEANLYHLWVVPGGLPFGLHLNDVVPTKADGG